MDIKYKNLDLVPGIPTQYKFEILDETYLKVDLTNHTFKLEVFEVYNPKKLVFTKTTPDSTSLGEVLFSISETDAIVFKSGLYFYRLVVISPNSISKVYFQGFISASTPSFNIDESVAGGTIILPDGTIYANSAIDISLEYWYAISSTYRFLVSGLGVLVIDGKDIRGTVWPNLSVFNSTGLDETRWIPDLAGMTSFRIKAASGSPTIRYLP